MLTSDSLSYNVCISFVYYKLSYGRKVHSLLTVALISLLELFKREKMFYLFVKKIVSKITEKIMDIYKNGLKIEKNHLETDMMSQNVPGLEALAKMKEVYLFYINGKMFSELVFFLNNRKIDIDGPKTSPQFSLESYNVQMTHVLVNTRYVQSNVSDVKTRQIKTHIGQQIVLHLGYPVMLNVWYVQCSIYC